MKKICTFVLVGLMLILTACQSNSHKIKITIPAGITGDYIYSEEEISPLKDKIKITAGEGFKETGAVLRAVEVKEERKYESFYLSNDMPVAVAAEKGGWFKIGIQVNNSSDEDRVVYLNVENIDVRIA